MDEKILGQKEAAQFCNTIQLNDFNKIQPHGVLFALYQNLHVVQYSENAHALLHTPPQELHSHPISFFLSSEDPNEDITGWLQHPTVPYKKLLWNSNGQKQPIFAYINRDEQTITLEIEFQPENDHEDNTLFDLTQKVISGMKNTMKCHSIHELAQTTCNEIQKFTDYDRVIIYRFDEHDQSGIVVGESLKNKMESYLGLRFPANDIPQSVREMYLKLPLRYIPSIDPKPVTIIPEINPSTNQYMDLAQANLRMVAPVHIQYMTNMHIKSATSVGIIQNNKLWGLIACHHREEKFLPLNVRLTLLLLSNTIATQMLALERSTDYLEEMKTVDLQTHLTTNIGNADSIAYGIDSYHTDLMELVNATGMSVFLHGILLNYGETPTNEETLKLVYWLQKQPLPTIYSTTTLPIVYEESMKYKDKACGLLAIKITAINDHYILFYKPERIDTIIWAGNPAETMKCSATSYSPRDSFERFLETINNQSSEWAMHEIKSAHFIKSLVANKQLQDLLQVQAMHDPLTGLLNRVYLEQRLSLEIQRASRHGKSLAILLADLDFFKKINDQYGHQAGDKVLIEFSALLKTQFRGYDYIYRYGGEEFLIILPETTLEAAKLKSDLLRTVTKNHVMTFNDKLIPSLSLSLGVSIYPDNGLDARSLIASADTALYQAKKNGRDQVVEATSR